MADTVTSSIILGGAASKKYIVHLTGISDGTGETNVIKVDRSALTAINRSAPTRIDIASVRWNIQGYTYIKFSWDHTVDDTALVLSGNGYDNFETHGGLKDPNTSLDTVTGAIGDLLLTSAGAVSSGSYDITLEIILV
jgi:hypothetical protein